MGATSRKRKNLVSIQSSPKLKRSSAEHATSLEEITGVEERVQGEMNKDFAEKKLRDQKGADTKEKAKAEGGKTKSEGASKEKAKGSVKAAAKSKSKAKAKEQSKSPNKAKKKDGSRAVDKYSSSENLPEPGLVEGAVADSVEELRMEGSSSQALTKMKKPKKADGAQSKAMEGTQSRSLDATQEPDGKGTALCEAVESGSVKAVKEQLKTCNPNWTDNTGKFPLQIASMEGWAAVTKALIDAKADVNKTTVKNQSTALHIAAKNGYQAVCEALVSAGASVHVVNRKGFDCITVAKDNDHDSLAAWLSRQK